jgi:threonine/homoserine/homoserine lactone efflux protein
VAVLFAVATFAAAAIVIILVPGPDTLVTVRSIVSGGRSHGVATAAGVLAGLSGLIMAAALGLAAVLRASEFAYDVLRVAGAAYLIGLGVRALLAARRPGAAAPATGEGRRGLLGTGFLAGLTTNLLNPKVGVFFVTFLPGFVPHGYPVGLTSLLFGAVFLALSIAYFAVLLTLAVKVIGWMTAPRTRRWIDAVTGSILVGFGIRLAAEA